MSDLDLEFSSERKVYKYLYVEAGAVFIRGTVDRIYSTELYVLLFTYCLYITNCRRVIRIVKYSINSIARNFVRHGGFLVSPRYKYLYCAVD